MPVRRLDDHSGNENSPPQFSCPYSGQSSGQNGGGAATGNGSWLSLDTDLRFMGNQVFHSITEVLKDSVFEPKKWKETLQGSLRNLGRSVMDASVKGLAKSIIPGVAGSIPFIGPFLKGFLGMVPFQEGGIVRGSRYGIPALLGERHTDEAIVPLSQLGRMMQTSLPRAGSAANVHVELHMSGSLVDTAQLHREVFRAAQAGQQASLARRISSNVSSGAGW